ncbi:hypothetical protein DV737_g5809, partial [Chaetothyriales sp. CBS 132003]
MAPNQTRVRTYTDKKDPSPASPSASVILISPANTVLLLHRKQTSSAFPSAHVFPGGNLDPSDGELPASPTDANRHRESLAYRIGAIRELFEETGILLAKESAGATSLLKVSDRARLHGRKAVHGGQLAFRQWLADQSAAAILHTDGLTPFTHWITPANVPKRFTTQMYIYFVHLKETDNPSIQATGDEVETMHPEYKSAREWMRLAQAGDAILFPPQFLLLHLISHFLDVDDASATSTSAVDIIARRRRLYDFITTDQTPVPWTHKYISPLATSSPLDGDDRLVLRLNQPGPELEGSGLVGDDSHVVLTKFKREGPRELEVKLRADVFPDEEKPKKTQTSSGGSGGSSRL